MFFRDDSTWSQVPNLNGFVFEIYGLEIPVTTGGLKLQTSYICYLIHQDLIQGKNDSGYRFWAPKVWRPNSFSVSLSVLSKTVENENYN